MRERFFTPRVRVKSYDELNALLLHGVIAYAKIYPYPYPYPYPEKRQRTVWQMFETERAVPVAYAGRFDGFPAVLGPASYTLITTHTRSAPRPSTGRSSCTPMSSTSRFGRTAACLVSMPVPLAAIRPCSPPGTTSPCLPGSLVLFGTTRHSRTEFYPDFSTGCGASLQTGLTATGRWSRSSPRCSAMG